MLQRTQPNKPSVRSPRVHQSCTPPVPTIAVGPAQTDSGRYPRDFLRAKQRGHLFPPGFRFSVLLRSPTGQRGVEERVCILYIF